MAIPPQQIIDQHRAHLLTGGLVGSKLVNPHYGEWFALSGSKGWMQQAHQLLSDASVGYMTWPQSRINTKIDWQDVIADAIARREVTTEFLEAWQFLGTIIGRLAELAVIHESSNGRFNQEFNSSIQSDNEARMCWFAQCLAARSAQYRSPKRMKAETEIHQIIDAVLKGRVVSPLKPEYYNKEWFRRFIVREKRPYTGASGEKLSDFSISRSFTCLKNDDVMKYVGHDHIFPKFLPPLYMSHFKPALKP